MKCGKNCGRIAPGTAGKNPKILAQILTVMFGQVFALGNARGAKGAMTRGDRDGLEERDLKPRSRMEYLKKNQ